MQKLNDPRRSLTPLDPDGTLFCGRPDRWRVWSWHISHVSPAGLYPLTYSGSKRRRVKVKRLTQGVTVKDIFWTQGRYDIVTIVEAPDEASAMSLNLSLGALGNVRTESLRSFSAADMATVVGKMI